MTMTWDSETRRMHNIAVNFEENKLMISDAMGRSPDRMQT